MTDLTRPIIGIENRTAQEVFDIMCDRIRHAPLLPREGVVEELEWRSTDGIWYKADAEFGGYYRIVEYPGTQEPFKLDTHGWWSGSPCGNYEFLSAAKAAAQADYERRIRAALRSGGNNG